MEELIFLWRFEDSQMFYNLYSFRVITKEHFKNLEKKYRLGIKLISECFYQLSIKMYCSRFPFGG